MSLHGAIDNYSISEGRCVLGGWAYEARDGAKYPVDSVRIDGAEDLTAEFYTMRDFGGENNRFRFRFSFSGVELLAMLLLGVAKCRSKTTSGELDLKLWNKIEGPLWGEVFGEIGRRLDDEARRALIVRVVNSVRNANFQPINCVEQVLVTPGFESYDGSVRLGKDGYFFLEGGTNSVTALYKASISESHVQKWENLIRERHARLSERGIGFVQIVIPEKQSVLSDKYPGDIAGQTPLLAELSRRLSGCDFFLDIWAELDKIYTRDGVSAYRKVDTHLSYNGARLIAAAICGRLDSTPLRIPRPVMTERLVGGDLGNKYGHGQFVEKVLVPDEDWGLGQVKPVLIDKVDPEAGMHKGIVREWYNDTPIINRSILVFGNSMFERGGSEFGLSWWFSRIFRRMRFEWSARVDYSSVEKFRPDYVVGQTVERFMTSCPEEVAPLV